jgi:ABC-type nitrate/sulfonate/bicarbonate transport system substrate-binding protein
MLLRRAVGTALACTLVVASCSSDETAQSSTSTSDDEVQSGQAFPEQRCQLNRDAGTIRYLSGFDYAAAASIVDVLVAKQKGYFDALCLDVEVAPSLSTLNYALVGSGDAEMASGGSLSELADYVASNADAPLVTLAVEGQTVIDTLIVKQGYASTLADLRGTSIGVKASLPVSIEAMLSSAGLVNGTDYTTTPVDGFDPVAHIAQPDIAAFAAYKSNEPGQLDRARIPFTTFDPATAEIPGTFGILFGNSDFVAAHPTAAADFVRAAMHGLADAIADPSGASMIALDFIDNNGNPNALSRDGEVFRWQTESKLVLDSTPTGEAVGAPDPKSMGNMLSTYADLGLFGGDAPDVDRVYDESIIRSIYDSKNAVIWPAV